MTSSHRAFSKYGSDRGGLMTRAIHANGATPIIGEISTRRVEPRTVAALDLVQRILQHERAAVRVADEHQRLAGTDPFAHVADAETDGGEPVLPDSGGEPGRHGAVPGHPQRKTVITARL
jgi:hypothetical protein